MKAWPNIPKTEVTIEDDEVVIRQYDNYALSVVRIPLCLWNHFQHTVVEALNEDSGRPEEPMTEADIPAEEQA